MFVTRLISGIVLVILTITLLVSGGNFLLGGLLIVSLRGLYELYRIFGIQKSVLGFLGYTCCIVYYLVYIIQWEIRPVNILPFYVALFILSMCAYVFLYPKYTIVPVMALLFGFLYIPVMLSFLYLLRSLQIIGVYMVWLVFLSSWGCDTFAYCAGKLFGKHKMAPILSPKKSVEGAIGGILGTILLSALYCYVFYGKVARTSTEVIFIVVACALGAGVSMIGDLCASAIKRNYDVKDYGHIIPGHGGILDRFDSVLIVAPVVFYVYYIYASLT